MEKTEEEKKASEQQEIEPWLMLKEAMDKLSIDHKSPDFNYEQMVKTF